MLRDENGGEGESSGRGGLEVVVRAGEGVITGEDDFVQAVILEHGEGIYGRRC